MAIFWIIILLPCIDLLQLKLQWNTHFDPYIAFLLAGESEGHITQILLFWFLPIYLLILCSDDYIQDVKTGYNNILIVKIGKADYIRDKFITSFLFPCLTMLFSLAINLVLSVIIFAGGTESSMMKIHDPANILFNFSQVHPLLIDIIFSLNVSLFAGLAGMLGASASFIFPDRKYAYPLTFFIWFILVALRESSITMIFQPFTEYDFNYMIPTFVQNFVILSIIPLITYFYKVKTDEL